MPIAIKEPITKPQMVFDKLWVTSIMISSYWNRPAYAQVAMMPYNSNGETSEQDSIIFQITDILSKIQAEPESKLAKAYDAILETITEEYSKL